MHLIFHVCRQPAFFEFLPGKTLPGQQLVIHEYRAPGSFLLDIDLEQTLTDVIDRPHHIIIDTLHGRLPQRTKF